MDNHHDFSKQWIDFLSQFFLDIELIFDPNLITFDHLVWDNVGNSHNLISKSETLLSAKYKIKLFNNNIYTVKRMVRHEEKNNKNPFFRLENEYTNKSLCFSIN